MPFLLFRINDPYKLPCGHTFCLRPCILSHAKAVTGRCISCHLEFNASELRPNYLVAAKLHLSLQEKSEGENNSSKNPKVSDLAKSGDQSRCSICQKWTDENQLKYCKHCHRNVCPTCLQKHFDSYSLQVRVQLTSMHRKERELNVVLQNLKTKLSAASSIPASSAKTTIISQLDEAIVQLKCAVSQSLENALRKVEVLEMDGAAVLKVKVDDLLASSSDLNEVEQIYKQLEDGTIRKLEDAEKVYVRLRDSTEKAKSVLESFDPLPTLPIVEFGLSKRVQENIEKLEEIDMIIGCGSVPLSSLFPDQGAQMKSHAGRGASTTQISKVKFFVGGLRRTHTEEHLRRYFESKYGPLVDCHVSKDFKTKESRGYAFVTFKEAIHASRAMSDFPHFIEGVPIQLRPYNLPNTDQSRNPLGVASSHETAKKPPKNRVVVVGISDTTTKDAIKAALSKIGGVLSVDMESKRGFGIVNFEKSETVDRAVFMSQVKIDGKDCDVYHYNIGKRVIREREGEGEKNGSCEHVDKLRLFIGNLNPSVSREMLKEHFSRFGTVTKVDIICNRQSSKPRGMAFVNMSSEEEVEGVLKGCPH
ncbi:unnamed protein product, partial [Rodentolepis nana]|uniref:RRM domain-containing protein n=1 Tax=Rodentolepis nana TaxID=102285 RepID=A0A0R3TEA2_RODNA